MNKKNRIFPLLLACAACFLARGTAPAAGEAAAADKPGYNIVLLVVDCLRADHLSLYGYGRKTSPNIDALARESAVFTRAIAQAPTTLLSFSSIFTSRYVSSHGVDALNKALGESALTLAEILGIYGYRTAAFVGGPSLHPLFKLDRGFDSYYHLNYTSASFRTTLPAALGWIRERDSRGEKFFVVAHGNDLHTPYAFPASGTFDRGFRASRALSSLGPDEEQLFTVYRRKLMLKAARQLIRLTGDDVGHITARYDEGILYSDALLGEFLAGLRAAGVMDRTVLIVTADHGEGLFDHDYFFHDFSLYDDTLRVPLIVKAPGAAKREITTQVRLIDLMPTALELAGIEPNRDAQGGSLVPLLAGGEGYAGGEYTLAESAVGSRALRSGKWKLILSPKKAELFDLERDPGERNDLAGKEKAKVAELSAILFKTAADGAKEAFGEALPAGGFGADRARADREQRRTFERLPGLNRTGRPQ